MHAPDPARRNRICTTAQIWWWVSLSEPPPPGLSVRGVVRVTRIASSYPPAFRRPGRRRPRARRLERVHERARRALRGPGVPEGAPAARRPKRPVGHVEPRGAAGADVPVAQGARGAAGLLGPRGDALRPRARGAPLEPARRGAGGGPRQRGQTAHACLALWRKSLALVRASAECRGMGPPLLRSRPAPAAGAPCNLVLGPALTGSGESDRPTSGFGPGRRHLSPPMCERLESHPRTPPQPPAGAR